MQDDTKRFTKQDSANTEKIPYVLIPNNFIRFALNHSNKLIIPVYLYSAVHQEIFNQCKVDTNMALIADTFDCKWTDIRDALKILRNSKEILTCIEYKEHIDNVKKTDRIEYYFINRVTNFDKGFVLVYFDEYSYLIEYYSEIKNKVKMNIVDIINIYTYMKMRISLFDNLRAKKGDPTIFMRETISTISSAVNRSRTICIKYINFLHKIGLIDFRDLSDNGKKTRIYMLSNRWKDLKYVPAEI